jgi:hypothetical protein
MDICIDVGIPGFTGRDIFISQRDRELALKI